jgi:hypothetical protein
MCIAAAQATIAAVPALKQAVLQKYLGAATPRTLFEHAFARHCQAATMSTQPTPLLIYQTVDGRIQIAAQVLADALWLMHQQLAQLFQTPQQNISLHLQNVYDEGELQPEASHKDFLSFRQEGSRQVSRQTRHYKLDAVLSLGYRVKSAVATRFRIWATLQLREYLSKGFFLDDERLKNPGPAGSDSFDELLARIQDIRSSERRFYQKITLRRVVMTMDDWIAKLHGFLSINDRDILNHAGKISHDMALVHTEAQFEFLISNVCVRRT